MRIGYFLKGNFVKIKNFNFDPKLAFLIVLGDSYVDPYKFFSLFSFLTISLFFFVDSSLYKKHVFSILADLIVSFIYFC